MLNRSEVETLPDLFNKRAAHSARQIAYQFFDKNTSNWHSITWRDTYKKSLNYRHALASEKLSEGSRVLLILENSIEWICLEQATLQLGLVIVAASPRDSLQAIRHIIQDCEPALIFIESDRLAESLQIKQNYIVREKLLPNSNTRTIQQWLEKNHDFPSEANKKVQASDLASIVYTSGSSGKAKGVMLSHAAIINNAYGCIEKMAIVESDKLLNVTPLAHILGRVIDYYLGMLAGTPLVFSRELGMIGESLKKTHATLITCTPHIIEYAYNELVCHNPKLKKYIEDYLDYSNGLRSWKPSFLLWKMTQRSLHKKVRQDFIFNLRAIFTGGASLSGNPRQLIDILGLPVFEGYGITEAGGAVSFNTPGKNHKGSVGEALPGTSIKIEPDGNIAVKNNSLMIGYWQQINTPAAIDGDDWLNTGDIGYFQNNMLYLQSRESSVIQLTNGNCIQPEPLENHLKNDSIFSNVFIFGQQKSKLTAICEIDLSNWPDFAKSFKISNNHQPEHLLTNERLQGILFTRINALLQTVANAPHIDYILPVFNDWKTEGLVNPQGKKNRKALEKFYADELEAIYIRGHILGKKEY